MRQGFVIWSSNLIPCRVSFLIFRPRKGDSNFAFWETQGKVLGHRAKLSPRHILSSLGKEVKIICIIFINFLPRFWKREVYRLIEFILLTTCLGPLKQQHAHTHLPRMLVLSLPEPGCSKNRLLNELVKRSTR